MTTLTSPSHRVEKVGMTMEELAALDAEYRERVRLRAIEETERGIALRRAQHADTANLERHLARLRG